MSKSFRLLLAVSFILFSSQIIQAEDSSPNSQTKTKAPNFYLKDLQDNSHFLNDYCGEKILAYQKNEKHVVLLSFFATWCVPCREEYLIFKQLSEKFADCRFKVILIDIEEKTGKVKKYVKEKNIQLPVLIDSYGVAKKKFGVSNIPYLFLIDPDQQIIYERVGFDAEFPLFETLSTKIDSLLKLHFSGENK